MMSEIDPSCGCPDPAHPSIPDIPSGLSRLPHHVVGFEEYRAAMLSAVASSTGLSGWRARGRYDLGLMLLEWWAYVLDVTAFYDERIAERSYLQSAPDTETAINLVSLLGHRPRPAMGATVKLGVTALGDDPVSLPAGAAFRSDAFDDEPGQIFELDADTTIWPQRNRWTLAPVRSTIFDGKNVWMGARRSPHVGATILLQDSTGTNRAVGRVREILSERAVDDQRYQRIVLRDEDQAELVSLKGSENVSLTLLRVELGPSPFVGLPKTASDTITLESLFPVTDTVVVIEIDGVLHVREVETTTPTEVTVANVPGTSEPVKTSVTLLKLKTSVPAAASSLKVHLSGLELGQLTQPAATSIGADALVASEAGGTLANAVRPLGEAPAAAEVIAQGSRDRGELLMGTIVGDGAPDARLVVDPTTTSFPNDLTTPVHLFGNVIEVTRGETAFNELLGVGDASAAFLTLPLRNQPLTWLEDHSAASGRSPELVVRVDGVEWARTDTFFNVGPTEHVYRVDLDAAGETSIVFGGDGFGEVPVTGAEIRADYRYGGGAATPPARAITKTASSIDGLDLVVTSLAATGGADAETIDELKTAAPAATLTLGRAVSLLDFEALAKSYANVVTASAGWAWDNRYQRASAKIWIIPAAGDPSADLAAWLRAQAVPDLAISVEAAQPAPESVLTINLDIEPRYNRESVADAVRSELFDVDHGLLAAANTSIGKPLFRSVIVERVHSVAGVRAINSILVDTEPMPTGLRAGAGRWFDFSEKAQVN